MTNWDTPDPGQIDLAQRYAGAEFGPSIGEVEAPDGRIVATVHIGHNPRVIGLNITEERRGEAVRIIEADDDLDDLRRDVAAADTDNAVAAAVARYQRRGTPCRSGITHRNGTATPGASLYCRCGLVFAERYDHEGRPGCQPGETPSERRAIIDRVDKRWSEHVNGLGGVA